MRCKRSRTTISPSSGRRRWALGAHERDRQPADAPRPRAEILRLRGDCEAAEHEASAACDELRPYLRRELGWPLSELGRIRLQRGDVAGAETAFLEAHDCGWDAQPGLALVHLAKNEIDLAARSIQYALEHPSSVPSKEQPPNTQLRLAPLLVAQVDIAIAARDIPAATTATDELERIATTFESKALAAAASLRARQGGPREWQPGGSPQPLRSSGARVARSRCAVRGSARA